MPDYDCFGHCVICHKNMVIEEAIDGRIQKRFTPDYDETQYLLDDDSKMRVAICKPCKNMLTDDDNDRVMQCVIDGWQVEVDNFEHWDDEKKKAHMDEYSQREIVVRSEGKDDDFIEEKLKEFKPKKVKMQKIGADDGVNQ